MAACGRWLRRGTAVVLWAVALATLAPRSAAAEGRLKVDLDLPLTTPEDGGTGRRLRLMLRTEQRFRNQGLVYFKLFAGVRTDLSRSVTLQVYGARKELMYTDEHIGKYMLVADLIPHRRFGRLTLADRSGLERHVTDEFFRYRNKLSTKIGAGVSWLDIWLAEEARFDLDANRVNMLDLQAGVILHPTPALKLVLYYDRELKRRGTPSWKLTNVIAAFVAVRLGGDG